MNKLPNCPICTENFNLKANIPLSLPCGHTICQGCVKGITKPHARNIFGSPGPIPCDFKCPICKNNCQFQQLSDIPKNFIVKEMLEQIESKSQDSCQKHKKRLKFFDEGNQKLLCTKCLLEHSNPTSIVDEKEFIEKTKVQGQATVQNILKWKEVCKTNFNKLQTLKRKQEQQINNTTEMIVNAINQWRRKELNEIEKFHNEKMKTLEKDLLQIHEINTGFTLVTPQSVESLIKSKNNQERLKIFNCAHLKDQVIKEDKITIPKEYKYVSKEFNEKIVKIQEICQGLEINGAYCQQDLQGMRISPQLRKGSRTGSTPQIRPGELNMIEEQNGLFSRMIQSPQSTKNTSESKSLRSSFVG